MVITEKTNEELFIQSVFDFEGFGNAFPALWNTIPNPDGAGYLTNTGNYFSEHGTVLGESATVTYFFEDDEMACDEEDYPWTSGRIVIVEIED